MFQQQLVVQWKSTGVSRGIYCLHLQGQRKVWARYQHESRQHAEGKSTDVSEEHIASIFDVKEQAEQDTSVKAGGKQYSLPTAFNLVSCSVYFSTLKMEAKYYFEMWVNFQRTTRRYIPGDRNFDLGMLVVFLILSRKMFAWYLKLGHSFI